MKETDVKSETSQSPWSTPGWMERASDWINGELKRLGRTVSGSIEQPHMRPWSTILRVPTPEGDVYFKACTDVLRHEVAVTQALAGWQPDCMPTLLVSEPDRGWMLMSDGGSTVRQAIKADEAIRTDGTIKADGHIRHWEQLLPRYVQLQIEMVDHVDDLLAVGIPNRLLATLPDQIEALLGHPDMLLVDQPEGLTSAEYERLVGMKDPLILLCEQLAASPVPESIHHGDFHDANIFLNEGRYVFFDWGDSSASHPFFSLRTAFVIIEHFQGYKPGSPELNRLRDVYLEPWRSFGDHEELIAAFDLSVRLSPLCSALGWNRVVSSLDDSSRADYAGAVPSLLKEFLELEDKANE